MSGGRAGRRKGGLGSGEIQLDRSCDVKKFLDVDCSLGMFDERKERVKRDPISEGPNAILDPTVRECLYAKVDRIESPHANRSSPNLARIYLACHDCKFGHNSVLVGR